MELWAASTEVATETTRADSVNRRHTHRRTSWINRRTLTIANELTRLHCVDTRESRSRATSAHPFCDDCAARRLELRVLKPGQGLPGSPAPLATSSDIVALGSQCAVVLPMFCHSRAEPWSEAPSRVPARSLYRDLGTCGGTVRHSVQRLTIRCPGVGAT